MALFIFPGNRSASPRKPLLPIDSLKTSVILSGVEGSALTVLSLPAKPHRQTNPPSLFEPAKIILDIMY
jgi:hypothetical protein